ncbi:MAG: DUF4231 domain-containing protein [Actinomycetota bacterium]|nr:DUF4231 domain-containing protein [Actinomycetota bacterium]
MGSTIPIIGKTVEFPNGNRATVVEAADGVPPRAVLDELRLEPPGALVLVLGAATGLDPTVVPVLSELLSLHLAPVARHTAAVVMDGGTDAGAMAVLGAALWDRGPYRALVGVAPGALVSYPGAPPDGDMAALEPHHSHFVLTPGDRWGDETELLFALADELAATVPVVAVLAGGGPVATQEVLQAVRRRWPVLVVSGTGGLADEVARSVEGRRDGRDATVDDPVVTEIASRGDIEVVPLREPSNLGATLVRRLRPNPSLELAWEQFAVLDQNAIRQQREFRRLQAVILVLGVVATLLAVTEGTLEAERVLDNHWVRDALRYFVIMVPIALAGLLTASARFGAGSKWVVLRGSAEAVKREIYRYRSRVGVYGDAAHARTPRQVRLADRVGTISGAVMKTDVNMAALHPYTGPLPPPGSVATGDDGFSVLTPDRYVELRLRHQAAWYQRKVVEVATTLRRLRWAIIAIGGLGTFLAAIGLELWIAVTTSVVGAMTTYLGFMQVEGTLLHYNQAAGDLETIRRWWTALPESAKQRPANVNRLVEQSERVMQSESAGWLQEMQDVMAELRRQQETRDGRGGEDETAERAPGPRASADGEGEAGVPVTPEAEPRAALR